MAATGFSFAIPFLPDYITKLGVTNPAEVYVWSGLAVAAPSWTMFIFAPIWGVLADKFGRKSMVMRAMFGGSVVIAAMGFIGSPVALLVLRLFQGAITGTVSASNALVSSVTPMRKSSFSLGLMQAALQGGALLGPLIGGYCADNFGYKLTFSISGACMLLGGLFIVFFAHEGPIAPKIHANNATGASQGTLWSILCVPGFAILIAIIFTSSFSRMVLSPLFLPFVNTLLPDSAHTKTITGSLFATTAGCMMVSAVVVGRLADKYSPKPFLILGTMFAGTFCIPQAFVAHMGGIGTLYILRMCIGFGTGMIAPALGGLVNRTISRTSQGKAFGLTQSATSLGTGLAPVTGGFLGAELGLMWPFVITGSFQILVGIGAGIALTRVPLRKEEAKVPKLTDATETAPPAD
jgi:DHA1 family multidrug resistance protein-like MFS transporter